MLILGLTDDLVVSRIVDSDRFLAYLTASRKQTQANDNAANARLELLRVHSVFL